MPYDSQVTRTDAAALIPEQDVEGILQSAVEQSMALSLFRTVPLTSALAKVPVMSTFPSAYWIAGDTGLKQTTEYAWSEKVFNVEEIAVILPIPDAVLSDAGYDLWGEIRPRLGEAIGRKLDAAIFMGNDAPASWDDADIEGKARAAGNSFALGTSTAAQGGIGEDLNQLMGLVEADGFDVNGFASRRGFKKNLRGARDTTGQRLLDVSAGSLEGEPIRFGMSALWPVAVSATPGPQVIGVHVIAGDFSQGLVGVRQDLTYKILDQAVITDGSGNIIYNLPQQDMVALRVVARYAYVTANPATHEGGGGASQYPFAVLTTTVA